MKKSNLVYLLLSLALLLSACGTEPSEEEGPVALEQEADASDSPTPAPSHAQPAGVT